MLGAHPGDQSRLPFGRENGTSGVPELCRGRFDWTRGKKSIYSDRKLRRGLSPTELLTCMWHHKPSCACPEIRKRIRPYGRREGRHSAIRPPPRHLNLGRLSWIASWAPSQTCWRECVPKSRGN